VKFQAYFFFNRFFSVYGGVLIFLFFGSCQCQVTANGCSCLLKHVHYDRKIIRPKPPKAPEPVLIPPPIVEKVIIKSPQPVQLPPRKASVVVVKPTIEHAGADVTVTKQVVDGERLRELQIRLYHFAAFVEVLHSTIDRTALAALTGLTSATTHQKQSHQPQLAPKWYTSEVDSQLKSAAVTAARSDEDTTLRSGPATVCISYGGFIFGDRASAFVDLSVGQVVYDRVEEVELKPKKSPVQSRRASMTWQSMSASRSPVKM
jgi:hypothetical protein